MRAGLVLLTNDIPTRPSDAPSFAATLRRHRLAPLRREAVDAQYMSLLVHNFNPAAVDRLMCRSLVSVGWQGDLYCCDFNQMLEMPISGRRLTLSEISTFEEVGTAPIATGPHCFGCTAGAGSSCGGETTAVRA